MRFSHRLTGPLVAWALVPILFAVTVVSIPGYGSTSSILSLLVLAAFLGVASVGQTLTILLGGIDLSIPAVIGMADVLTARWYGAGLPFWATVAIILVLSIVVGAANGFVSRAIRAHPLVVTLAMNFVVLGVVLVYTKGTTTGTVPAALTSAVSPIGKIGPLSIPPIVAIWAALSLLVIVLERYSTLGRLLYASGANPRAARLALVPVGSIWVGTFAASSVFAAITGVLLAGFSGGADASVGTPYLFETVAAVVVGGTSLLGGIGGYGRTVAGALLITEITTLLIGLGFGTNVQQMLLGVLIIGLVAIYGRSSHVRTEV